MKPIKPTLHHRALLAFGVGTCLVLTLVLISWQGLTRTQAAVDQFESLLIPEIRNALALSDEAAQIVAMAPYLASAGRPMQLQTERQRLNSRYDLAYSLSQRLQNPEVRGELQDSLERIRADLVRLSDRVGEELFTREDLFAAQFEVDQLAAADQARAGLDPWLPLQLYYLSVTHPDQYIRRGREGLAPLAEAVEDGSAYRHWLDQASDDFARLARIERDKAFLLARLRAQSERLTEQTNRFAAEIQGVVLDQQRAVSTQVSRTLALTVGLGAVLLLAIAAFYLGNRRLIRDLAVVTDDMGQLSRGEDAPARIEVRRHDEIGELVTAYDVFRDHARQAERTSAELEAQKSLLETTFNQIQDGLSVFSADGRLVAWNRRYQSIFGFRDDQLREGLSLAAVQALMARQPHRNLTVHQESVDMAWLNAERHHRSQSFERHYDDGRIVEFRSQPMPQGGFVTLYSDLTERRRAEQQLQQSQKMEVLGQLTGGVAHDFNNLLAALIGNLQLLEGDPDLSERSARYLHRALGVSERGSQLVQRLLAFGRKQRLQPELVEVDALLAGMTELLEYSLTAQARLELDLNAPGRRLYIDPSQLENAVLNLVLNSAAALPGAGWVRLSSRYRAEVDRVSIEVADNGRGIPPELQKRVLEPFFTTKPVGQGSGLGLSTVYGFVRQSDGHFELDSRPDAGTRIRLSWPEAGAGRAESVEPAVPPLRFDTERGVVLVEDDEAVRLALAELFRARGLTAWSFAHGEQFLDWMQHRDVGPGLVVSDVNLGGMMTGLDVAALVAKYWPACRCLLVSGLPRERLESELGLSIDTPFVRKPLTPALFRQLFPDL